MDRVDFIVIGAGIAGASAAAELSSAHRVCLLEAEPQPGFHSTGRSAALFLESYGNRVIRNLSRASRQHLFDPPPPFALGPWTKPRGALFIASHEQADKLLSLSGREDVRSSAREVTAAAAQELCPVLRSGYVGGALYEPNAADIDVHGLHQAYLKQFRANAGVLATSHRVDAIAHSAGHWEVQAGTKTFAAPVVINAAGAWADQIALLAGVTPAGLQPMRRTAILVDAPEGYSTGGWPLVIAADESFYFKPDAGLLLLSPADETPMEPCDVQPDEWDIAVAIDRVTTAADIAVHRIRHRWAGLRTFVQDRSPVVGFDSKAAGFFWLAGQGGYGVQTAPALARVAAALACERPIPQALGDFGVEAGDLSPGRLGARQAERTSNGFFCSDGTDPSSA
ncbi:MAG: FAD-binding oxidoreductase [Gammaproteobacteria bacterium]|nr:FAD-binding oxidoreductase [Gammaproteobacteria bacterium]